MQPSFDFCITLDDGHQEERVRRCSSKAGNALSHID